MTTNKILNLGLGLLFVAAAITAILTTTTVQATTEDDNENDAAIQEKLDKIDDQTKKMAEEAFLNGTCLSGLDKMKILAHPDSDVARLGIEIPTCGPGF